MSRNVPPCPVQVRFLQKGFRQNISGFGRARSTLPHGYEAAEPRADVGALPPEYGLLRFEAKKAYLTAEHCAAESFNGGSLGDVDQLGRGAFNFVGQVIHLLHPLRNPVMKHRKPSGSVESGALFVVRVKRCEQHRHRVGSSMRVGGRYLEQPPPGCFRSRAYAAAKRDTDRKTVVFVEHGLCLLEGEFGALRPLSGDRH
ncbi:hypothetical protein, partial [Mesorhizobium sp.]|uniref:hypothetical protein n=1 Tax=Mesorhizobium sp. TaxID=1871066 RepID=UPI00260FCE95